MVPDASGIDAIPTSPVASSPYPKFHNDLAVAQIRIGARAFHCIGALPPQDHPHVYLNMGAQDDILCPYCATRYRFDPALERTAADPAACAYADV